MAAGSIILDLLLRTGSFETDTKRAEKRLRELGKEAKAAGALIGAAGAAAAIGLAAMVKSAIDDADELSKMAQKVGIGTEALSRLDYAAKLSDVSLESLGNGIKRLGQFQAEALKGGKEQNAILDQLGVSAGNAETGIRDANEMLRDLADIFAAMPDGANKTALAVKLFGKAGADLIPLLNSGSKGLDEFAAKSDLVGFTLKNKTGKEAEAFNDQMTEFNLSIAGIARQALPALLPKLAEFGDLLNSQDFRDGFSTLIQGAVTAVGALVKLATTTANVTRFLGEEVAARIHGPSIDDVVRIEQRMDRIKTTMDAVRRSGIGAPLAILDASELIPQDLLSEKDTVLKRLQGELDKEQNKLKIGMELRADSVAKAARIAQEASKPVEAAAIDWTQTGVSSGGKGSGKRSMPDFSETHDDLQRLVEAEFQARKEFDAMAASLAGPVAEANYQYATDLERLNELARTGAVDSGSLAKAQDELRKAHEANVEAIEAQLDPGKRLLEDLQFELDLLKMTNAERETAIQLRSMDAESVAQYGDAILEANQALEQARKTADLYDFAQGELADSFVDIVSVAKSAKDALTDFFDSVAQQVLRMIAEDWAGRIMQLFRGTGSAGSAGGGTDYSSLLPLIFGGAKAGGGDVMARRAYLVGEQGPEMFVPRTAGTILPASDTARLYRGDGGRSVTVNQTIQVEGRPDNRAADQIAYKSLAHARQAARRNGFG